MGDDPIPGLSDLASARPSVAAEWHPGRNGPLAPEHVRAGSLRPVWWLGACGHSWEATVLSRAVLGEGCPICAGRPPLREAHPSLAAEWHPTRNGKTAPDDVTAGSTRPAWWLGKCGHEWRAGVGSRARGAGCPYCSGRRALAGFNDLATTHPDLAAQWHPERNGGLAPTEVSAGSPRKAWWLGGCGHEWEGRVWERARGAGCPYCAGRAVLSGFNDLESRFPEVVAEWDAEGNGGTLPSEVHFGSKMRARWVCGACGFSWEAAVAARTAAGSGCPACAGQALFRGVNDLATVRPDLAAAWHPERNGSLGPADVVAGGAASVWWLCPRCGASWKSQLCNRVRGRRPLCPECSRREGAAKRLRPVRCVETGAAYPCAADAAAAMGLKSRQSISQACRKPGTTAAGFHWEYA